MEAQIEITITEKPLTPIQEKVLQVLKDHEGFMQTRRQLQFLVCRTENNASNDRKIRKAIEDLRNRGYVITSTSDGRGYRLATEADEVQHYYAEQIKRARTILRTAYKVKRAYGLRDQLPLSVYRGKVTA
jgi:type IV secretory pathway VirB4 component